MPEGVDYEIFDPTVHPCFIEAVVHTLLEPCAGRAGL
jgi:hypothetical protein